MCGTALHAMTRAWRCITVDESAGPGKSTNVLQRCQAYPQCSKLMTGSKMQAKHSNTALHVGRVWYIIEAEDKAEARVESYCKLIGQMIMQLCIRRAPFGTCMRTGSIKEHSSGGWLG